MAMRSWWLTVCERNPFTTFLFFGVKTRVYCENLLEISHLRNYYRDYLCDDEAADISVSLTAGGLGFMSCLLREDITKTISVRFGSAEWIVYEQFSRQARRITPIPPFGLSPLADRLRLLHASAATLRSGTSKLTLVVFGDSGAGKSSILMTLLGEGWLFVCDDMLVVDLEQRVLPFTRPIGIREGLLLSLPSLWQERVRSSGTLVQGGRQPTYMIHPRDLGVEIDSEPASNVVTIQLNRGDQFSLRRVSQRKMVLHWRPELHQDAFLKWARNQEVLPWK